MPKMRARLPSEVKADEFKREFNYNLIRLLALRGYEKKDLPMLTGCVRQSWYKWEANPTALNFNVLFGLSVKLNVPIDEFFKPISL